MKTEQSERVHCFWENLSDREREREESNYFIGSEEATFEIGMGKFIHIFPNAFKTFT